MKREAWILVDPVDGEPHCECPEDVFHTPEAAAEFLRTAVSLQEQGYVVARIEWEA